MGINLELFESKVDRTGEHHVWTGAVDQSGTGQFKVDGRVRSPASVSWELTHGDVPDGHRVQSCPDERSCIHPEHLRLQKYGSRKKKQQARAERGSGSMRETSPGKWKLTVDAGRDDKGRRRRVTRTVRGTKREAARALAVLHAEVQTGERRRGGRVVLSSSHRPLLGLLRRCHPAAW